MKKVISLALVLAMTLGCIGLVACLREGGGTAPPQPEDGLTWADVPIYSGATQIQEESWKGSWIILPAEKDWSKVEWRYYTTRDSVSVVVSFLKSQMPINGWQEMSWWETQETPERSWGYYTKNNEQDGAIIICVSSDEGENLIALMRATE